MDKVIELSKELNVMDDKELEEFKNTTTYQELLNKHNSLLKNELNSKQKDISNEIQNRKDAQKLNWVLGGLTKF